MSSVAALVEKATSDLLVAPDWGKNLELCDIVNSDPGQAKEVVKAIRKRLTKNSSVQLLTLTVLETLVKNCGDSVHQQVAERDVLHDMVKLVKKKADMGVRDKVLVLLDSWQEAFGGARGRYPQYYAAYNELRQLGVEFPERAPEEFVPIFTPPQTHPVVPPVRAEAPPSVEVLSSGLSLSDLQSSRGSLEVFTEMLSAIDPRDRAALKEELIVELAEQCRMTQKQIMHLVNTSSDETILFQALSLNDDLQKALARYEAMAAGAPIPTEAPLVRVAPALLEEEEPEDDNSPLARRTTRSTPQPASKPIVPILPPPRQPTKLSAGMQKKPVDLLSGDSYSAVPAKTTVAAQSFASQPAAQPAAQPATQLAVAQPVTSQPITQPVTPQPVAQPVARPAVAQPAATFASQPAAASPASWSPATSMNEPAEDPDNVNPFALQYSRNGNETEYTRNASSPWSASSSSSSSSSRDGTLSAQQQAMLYGGASSEHSSGGALPPPPIKHSQRQQFFQQQQQSSSAAPFYDDEQLASRAEQSLAIEDEHMVNPYAGLLQNQDRQSAAAAATPVATRKPTDNLFGDLVELQSARMKAAGRPS